MVDSPMPDGDPNARARDHWNGPATRAWVTLQARIDRLFEPLTAVALDLAGPQPGERVVDIGCGCGATVLALAGRVGATGRVLGIDISAPMLARARERAAAAGLAQVELTLADLTTHAFAPASIDLAFSRFGVMFFRDPVAAFANLRRAMKPGGRLVFVVFRPARDNPWVLVPMAALKSLLPPLPTPGPEEPGQFAFGDPDRVRRILTAAGFREVGLTPHDPLLTLAGPGGAAEAADFSAQIGGPARALTDAPQALRDRVRAALEEVYRRHDGPNGIALPAGVWLVTARP